MFNIKNNKRIIFGFLGTLIIAAATYFSKHETAQEQEQKQQQILQQKIDISVNGEKIPITLKELPSKLETFIQENKSCSRNNDELLTKLEIANSTNTTLENENVLLKEQIQKLKTDNTTSCPEPAIHGSASNSQPTPKKEIYFKRINKDNYEIDLKECRRDGTEVTCHLLVKNKGTARNFHIDTRMAYIVDSENNTQKAKHAKIANGKAHWNPYHKLFQGTKASTFVLFENFTSNENIITVLGIYMAGSESIFRNVPLSD